VSDLLQLSSVVPEFLVTGSAGLGEPTLAQKQAKLLLLDFFGPAGTPLQPDVSKRRRYTLDVFGDDPVHGRTCTLRLSGSSATARPRIYMIGVSYSPQVDTTVSRFTTWDDASAMTDKMVKGVILEVDTRGHARTVQVEGDGEVLASFVALAQGRKVLHFSWPQFRARMLRLRASDTSHWRLYKFQWIFDEEPLELTQWETQPTNHGIPGYHSFLAGDISYRSLADVILEVTAFGRKGEPTLRTYTLGATAGAKRVDHVLAEATQGMLYKYRFVSSAGFHLYREESSVEVQAWGAPESQIAHPFGNDDLASPSRSMAAASLTAARPGGG
jgi:hypothetical protein